MGRGGSGSGSVNRSGGNWGSNNRGGGSNGGSGSGSMGRGGSNRGGGFVNLVDNGSRVNLALDLSAGGLSDSLGNLTKERSH